MKLYKVFFLLLIVTSAFSAKVEAQQSNKIYWMSTLQISYGKIAEFHQFFNSEMLPVYNKAGYKFLHNWQTIIGNTEEVTMVAEFDDLAAYQNARTALSNNEKWKDILAKFDKYLKGGFTKILTDINYSLRK